MTRLHAAPYQTALHAIDCYLGWTGGWMPVDRRREGRDARWWHRPGRPGSAALLARTIAEIDARYSDEVLIGLPWHEREAGGTTYATCLWCRVEGTDQARRAARFRPLPSMVIREGLTSRRWLLWPLRSRESYFDVVEANRRIAYRLRAVQKWSDPDRLWLPAPGTALRVGRARPVPIVVSRLTLETFDLARVIRGLRPPPEPKWWEATG